MYEKKHIIYVNKKLLSEIQTSNALNTIRMSFIKAIIKDPKATVPKWNRIKIRKLFAIGQPSWLLFLVKNHFATDPATTIC